MSAAQKETPTWAVGAEAGDAQSTEQNPAIVSAPTEHSKRFATLAARAALAGHHLTQTGSGYILSQWTHSRHFTDLDTAEALIARIEGSRK